MNDVALVAVRWALYVDLGLLFGLPLFALYAPGGGRMVQRHLPMAAMVAGLACLALLLSALGFALQAAAMTGLPLAQPDLSMVAELFNGTSMGTALKARLVALLVLLLCIPFYRRQSRPAFIASTLAGAVALATLAWSGHGAAGEGEAGWLQLLADLIHLLAAGAWVGALAAFLALVLPRLATDDVAAEDMDQVTLAEEALRGFSLVGTIIVALLILTGTVNGWFLVGPGNIASLGQSSYGLLLIAKLVLFGGMLGLAALNRYRLTPALAQAIEEEDAPRAQALLRASLFVEGGLAIVILGLVAWLGTLSPPMSMQLIVSDASRWEKPMQSYTPPLGTGSTKDYDRAIRLWTREKRWRAAMLAALAPKAGETVVDVGCGTGSFALMLKQAEPRTQVIGLDPDAEALDIARHKAAVRRADIDWRQGFARDVAPGAADAVVSSLVLHQMPVREKAATLRAMFAMLRPGGRLVIADYGRQQGFMRLAFRLTVQRLDGIDDTRPNADGVLPGLIAAAGFRHVAETFRLLTITGAIDLFTAHRPAQDHGLTVANDLG